MSDVEVWGVYYVEFQYATKKFVALYQVSETDQYGYEHPHWVGCCISTSRQNIGDSTLSRFDIPVPFSLNQGFLKYDSYLNMGRYEQVPERDLHDFKDFLDRGTQKRIVECAGDCPALSPRQRDIISNLQTRRS
jgi:hypothetical protein